jgi:hypothetical protein
MESYVTITAESEASNIEERKNDYNLTHNWGI